MYKRISILVMCLTLMVLINSCNITGLDDVYIIDQEFITGTWYAEYEVLNPTDTSYKYYTTTITINQVLNTDDYPGAGDLKYNYDFQVGHLLHLEIREETQSGSTATTSMGYLWDPVEEYTETMNYTYTSTLSGGGSWNMTFTQTNSNPDSLLIQFGTNSYKASSTKSTNKH